MSRKPVLEGGKRDEIIYVAMQLFFENGYEGTSVRMILEKVNGEIGMFYHYFKSKEELFQKVVERFFEDYAKEFNQIADKCSSKEQFIEYLLELFESSMKKFNKLSKNMHWTIQYAMAARTIEEMKPTIISLINKWGYQRMDPVDIVAGQFLYAISATLHSESFTSMSLDEKKNTLLCMANLLL